MEKLLKPITVRREEFIEQLTNLINNSGLPFFAVESVMRNTINEVATLSKQQYEMDLKRYEQMREITEKEVVSGDLQYDGEDDK